MLCLRDYQDKSLLSLRQGFIDGYKTLILYMPTGGGKTESAITLLVATAKKGKKAAMVMDRRILVDQTSQRLDKYGIDHGVLMADHWRWRPQEDIQICSAQTLEKCEYFPKLDLIIVDECHTVRKSVSDFIKNTGVRSIGLSSSPFTKGLGKLYEDVVCDVTTNELVNDGSLVPLRIFCAKEIDMTGAKKVAGEWSQKESTERGIKITGDIVTEWVKKTHEFFDKPEKTIVFCAGVAHGEDLQKRFQESGYNFVSISYRDDNQYKKDVIEEFSKPDSDIVGLIATDILTKGFDVPDVKIGISARPFTKSFSSHVQQMGRVMRSFPGKDFALWLDHSGNYIRFQDEWEELYSNGVSTLDDGKEKPKPEPSDKEKEVAKCPKCQFLWPPKSDICSNCGHVRERKNDVIIKAGELEEINGASKKEKYSSEFKESFYRELLKYADDMGYNSGWAYYKYHDKFKIYPSWKKEKAEYVSQEVMNYIISQNIRYAKRRRA